ncbi:hypothetical protein [Catellatospora methionotrophica]|uniref:hypothetical protein n=1 Tax=Catellatospora methionotrophica TaxID=121620 RepID=UPI003400BE78
MPAETRQQTAPVDADHPVAEVPVAPRDRGGAVEWTLFGLGMLSLVFANHKVTWDARRRYDALDQLLSGDGLSEDRYSLLGPLFATPMWLAGQVIGRPDVWLAYFNLVVFALALLALHLLLRGRVDAGLLRRFLLLLVVGSMIPAHISNFYAETFSAMTVGVGLIAAYLAATHPWWRRLGWAGLALGTANIAATLPALALTAADRAVRLRRLRYAVPVVTAVLLVLGEAWLRRSDPLDQGYTGERFDYPMALGVLAILFSFGKGLVWFTPGLFLPIRRRLRGLYDAGAVDLWGAYRSWLIYVGAMVAVYANWWAWSGDLYWGPRFFLLAVLPAALALAVWLTRPDARAWPNVVLLGVLSLSVWVAANSSVFESSGAPRCYDKANLQEDYCRFGVVESDLWYPLTDWPGNLAPGRYAQLAFFAVVWAWLAAPILARLTRSATAWLRAHPLPSPAQWRW